jgi:alkanesulfonate monooxygenase SsuD/methylene tetrahydromethanopterin reductase-like flavin-dependent oxidoreductase (luciferase family)
MSARYKATVDMAEWADSHGFDICSLEEHHGADNGWSPSPLIMASAVFGRTKNISISISALLVPLHDPLRIAEDIAVLDVLSGGGRIGIIAGLGYRPEEFAMFGVDRKRRGAITEESLRVMLAAWTGEPFEYRGTTVRVTPKPVSQPHPLVLVGGSTEIAAKRAARLHLPFMPAIGDPELQRIYDEACAAEGYTGFTILPSGPGFVHVTDDPERDWQRIAPHALHEARTYASWQTGNQRSQVETHAETIEELKASGVYAVVTPDECVELAKQHGTVVLHPLMGGMDPDLGWESLQLFADKVAPRL